MQCREYNGNEGSVAKEGNKYPREAPPVFPKMMGGKGMEGMVKLMVNHFFLLIVRSGFISCPEIQSRA